eukprot:15387709-Alexandrium_andersonii.AAC.1
MGDSLDPTRVQLSRLRPVNLLRNSTKPWRWQADKQQAGARPKARAAERQRQAWRERCPMTKELQPGSERADGSATRCGKQRAWERGNGRGREQATRPGQQSGGGAEKCERRGTEGER